MYFMLYVLNVFDVFYALCWAGLDRLVLQLPQAKANTFLICHYISQMTLHPDILTLSLCSHYILTGKSKYISHMSGCSGCIEKVSTKCTLHNAHNTDLCPVLHLPQSVLGPTVINNTYSSKEQQGLGL